MNQMSANGIPTSSYPQNTILAGIVGSTAYGLTTESSDIDTLGVYVVDTQKILGLRGTRYAEESIVHTAPQPDATFHELGKYVRLALKANPTILELLYLPEYTITTPLGENLVELKNAFLSAKTVRDSYGGYALSQAKRLTARNKSGKIGFSANLGKNRVEKHGRHCIRLILQGKQLLTTGMLVINMREQKDFLFDSGKLAATNPEAFQQLAEKQLAELDKAFDNTVLPQTPDIDRANDFVVSTRLELL